MAGFDPHSLFAYSRIVSVSGTSPSYSIGVTSGTGSLFSIGQNVTLWQVNTLPTFATATIGRITAITTDTLSITTGQEGTSTSVAPIVNWQISNALTPKVMTDLEAAANRPNNYNIQSNDYTVLSTDRSIYGNPTTVNINFTLPDATTSDGLILEFKHIGSTSYLCKISPVSSQTVDGAPSRTLMAYDAIRIQAINTGGTGYWYVK